VARRGFGPLPAALSVTTDSSRAWWERPAFLVALALIAAVPLLYPPIPPLVDLLGHMGRYRVELDLDSSQWLARYYGFHWLAIGNLGVDLLVWPLARLIGLEPAVKLIVLTIPVLTVAGFLFVAREVHGRVPPTALFALPFAYGLPFLFGFVNFALAMALAFLAFGLWLRLGRLQRFRLRAVLFVPISIIVFFTHVYGWAALGLLCFSAEVVRGHDRGLDWVKALAAAALQVSVMALPIAIVLAWRAQAHGGMTSRWFDWRMKVEWIYTVLRDRWKWFDLGALVIGLVVIVEARRRSELAFSRNLAFSALILAAAFVLLPWHVFGSAYADMRLVPYIIATAILAIRGPTNLRLAQSIAVLGLVFYVVRIAGTTVSLAIAANDLGTKLQALDRVPMGARVATMVGSPCTTPWSLPRLNHIGAMVIVRRQGFSNDQWVTEGANLLQLRYQAAGAFAADPSQIVTGNECRLPGLEPVDEALKALPRDQFEYLWLVEAPGFDARLVAGMQPVWRNGSSILYRLHR
jgi:hypothetical protein